MTYDKLIINTFARNFDSRRHVKFVTKFAKKSKLFNFLSIDIWTKYEPNVSKGVQRKL